MNKKLFIIATILIVVLIGLFTFRFIQNRDTNQFVRIWGEAENVNKPILHNGMKAIRFTNNSEEPAIVDANSSNWYDYKNQETSTQNGGTSEWANSITEDGSMWVWIPRFAYKIEWDKASQTGKIDVKFLQGVSKFDIDGNDVTKLGYKIHPAFQDGSKTGFNNGEWDKEITGFWISKFEAGFTGQKNTSSENIQPKNSSLVYKRYLDNVYGTVEANKTYMKYPIFAGKAIAYNNLEIEEMYNLSQILNENGNPYGFNDTIDIHMIKNSEWGAVAYLAHSQYGRNGSKIAINNICLEINNNDEQLLAEAITGYAGDSVNSKANKIELNEKLKDSYDNKSFAWYTEKGKLASTTGNLYGVYDMNGGASEYVAGYLYDTSEELSDLYAHELLSNKSSNKYYTVYKSEKNDKLSANKNYLANENRYGDATIETSKKGTGYTSWFGETSAYILSEAGFFLRSGAYNRLTYSGIFDFNCHSGHAFGNYSFRCAIIDKN